jgi:hypothetical protein
MWFNPARLSLPEMSELKLQRFVEETSSRPPARCLQSETK